MYVRGKYRDVILPITVIRRLDAVLEPAKEAVLKLNEQLDRGKVANKGGAPCAAAKQAFFIDTFRYTLLGICAAGTGNNNSSGLRGLPRRLFAERPGDPRQV